VNKPAIALATAGIPLPMKNGEREQTELAALTGVNFPQASK
jgi:hypothetical protein